MSEDFLYTLFGATLNIRNFYHNPKKDILVWPNRLTIKFDLNLLKIDYELDPLYKAFLLKQNVNLNSIDLPPLIHKFLKNELIFPFFLKDDLIVILANYTLFFL